ncbi:DUF6283 family protein [Catenuloplanes indicus]|uniref:Uncharacterized protein n=1 Tax=Catenuloplanes indicus TaxID=137267 RepID=A0AAE3VTI2_9ACTN|nr:DUF6283 family protein [Catenuloplanes indicus]MDQ0363416.1 hypothetical protein [Catenuloplanes indicus]
MAAEIARRRADLNHDVVTLTGSQRLHRRSPCGGCPWRTDQNGSFPAEAFRLSAPTAYDMADRAFGCHEASHDHPLTCAGFLLRGADHNFAIRLAAARGDIDLGAVHDGGHNLHDSYRAMSVANGVDPDDPALRPCRP